LFVDHRQRWVLCRIPSLLFLLPVVRVLSSALSPGFIGPESSVLPVNLPPFAPCPASGSPSRFGFIESLAPLGFQCRRVSLGKMHQPPRISSNFTAVRFTGYPVSFSHVNSTSSPRHIVVRCSLRTQVLPHASSRLLISEKALALSALSFRPVTVDVLLPSLFLEGRSVLHARRT